MDNNNGLTLTKELSSYSSFFKTQTSINNDTRNISGNKLENGHIQHGSTNDYTKDASETNMRHSSPVKDSETVQNTIHDTGQNQLKQDNGRTKTDNVHGLELQYENILQNDDKKEPENVLTNTKTNNSERKEIEKQTLLNLENAEQKIKDAPSCTTLDQERTNNPAKDTESIEANVNDQNIQNEVNTHKTTDDTISEQERNNLRNYLENNEAGNIDKKNQNEESTRNTDDRVAIEQERRRSSKSVELNATKDIDQNIQDEVSTLKTIENPNSEQRRINSTKYSEDNEAMDINKLIQNEDSTYKASHTTTLEQEIINSANDIENSNSQVIGQTMQNEEVALITTNSATPEQERSNLTKDKENTGNLNNDQKMQTEDPSLQMTDGRSPHDNDMGNTKTPEQTGKDSNKKPKEINSQEVEQLKGNTNTTSQSTKQSNSNEENHENDHQDYTKQENNSKADQTSKPADVSENSQDVNEEEQSRGAHEHVPKSNIESNITNSDVTTTSPRQTPEPLRAIESSDVTTNSPKLTTIESSNENADSRRNLGKAIPTENTVNRDNSNENTSKTITIPQCEIVSDHDETILTEEQMPSNEFIESETVFITGITSPNYAVKTTGEPHQAENNTLNTKEASDTNIPLNTEIDGKKNDAKRGNANNGRDDVVVDNNDTKGDTSDPSLSPENMADMDQADNVLEAQVKHVDDNRRNTEQGKVDTDNIYFTGRLPTIVNMNEKSHHMPTNGNEQYSFEDSNLDQNINNKEPTEGSGPTANKEVKRLLETMNEPVEPRDAYSRGNHLTPSRMFQKGKSVISTRTAKTDVVDETKDDDTDSISDQQNENTEMTVRDINMYTNKIIRKTNSEEQDSKFADLKHMKNISEYVQQNIENGSKKWEHDDEDVEFRLAHDKTHKQKEEEDTPHQTNITPAETRYTAGEKRNSNNNPVNRPTKLDVDIQNAEADTSHEQSDISNPYESTSREVTGVRRSTSENDLKAIIASAKMAYGDTTDESDVCNKDLGYSERANVSMVGESKPLASKPRSFGNRYVGENTHTRTDDHDETLSSLICSSCLQVDTNIQKSGFCTSCQTYLCNTCITVHLMDGATKSHHISPSYCKNDLHMNKYVHATGYCADCNTFLCSKCTIQHSQLRANRRHKIIQSSFVSKQTERQKESNDFLNELQDKLNSRSSEASSIDGTEKKRRRLLTDLKTTNPYRNRFGDVSESVYPGPKKKLGTSYTKRPKWPHSSLPALPYLVQPKFIKEKFSYPKHLGFSSRKKEIAYMSARLKALQARYNVLPEYEKLYSKKEQQKFKRTVGHPIESISLPDIDASKGNNRTVKTVPLVQRGSKCNSGLRQSDFIGEYHLTLPVATCEKPTEIIAMAILYNGNLAVIDKNNNNLKIYNKAFACKAALQFHNRLVDITASNICPSDVYVAIPKHVYEVSNEHGLEVKRKMKVEIKRIEGLTYWKYGIAVISKQSNITWELRLLDYRGNQKSKLEIFNPLTCDIASSKLCHVTTSKGGKRISISDSKNFCIITVDVTSRDVQHETSFGKEVEPTYLTSDGDYHNNIYVSSKDKVYQISRTGKVKGIIIDRSEENGSVGSIVCNSANDRLYVQTGKDRVAVYQLV
ncbi:hypothetical protein ACF0H5_011562 [Mactra antiquata]